MLVQLLETLQEDNIKMDLGETGWAGMDRIGPDK
jgi:hypothetical protein